jgi:hypothetical protein
MSFSLSPVDAPVGAASCVPFLCHGFTEHLVDASMRYPSPVARNNDNQNWLYRDLINDPFLKLVQKGYGACAV